MGERDDIRDGILEKRTDLCGFLRWLLLIAALLLFLVLLGCTADAGPEGADAGAEESVTLNLNLLAEGIVTKAGDAEIAAVNDLNVYFINGEGQCEAHSFAAPGPFTVTLRNGKRYDIYVVTDIGRDAAVPDLAALRNLAVGTSSAVDASKGIGMVMSGIAAGLLPSEMSDVTVELERRWSEIVVTVDTTGLVNASVRIDSLMLRNIPATIRPFGENVPASPAETTFSGTTVGADLNIFDRGDTLYCYENRQGTLLEGNTDQKAKAFADGDPAGDRCTYLELYGRCDGESETCKIRYRMYLGGDNCSDFTLLGNRRYRVEISLTGDGRSEASWRVVVYDKGKVLPKPGYFFYSDSTASATLDPLKTCVGIVYSADSTRPVGNRLWVVALDEFEDVKWSTVTGSIAGLVEETSIIGIEVSDPDGKNNTRLISLTPDYGEMTYPAAWCCLNYSTPGFGAGSWCLGSFRQMLPLYDIFKGTISNNVVNSAIVTAGGVEMGVQITFHAWTSTPESQWMAYGIARHNPSNALSKGSDNFAKVVRPILQL